ncbi:MAG TPA: TorF family putative porin [Gammaproteobacteria bacterium]
MTNAAFLGRPRRLLHACFTLFIAGVFLAAPARAARSSEMLTGYVSLLSNYVGRGLAQSVGNPSLQAELNVNPSDGLYGGASASSINWIDQLYPGSSVSVEVDGWLGYRKSFANDWTFKGGVLRLQFPGEYAAQTVRPDTTEVFAFIGWRSASARLNYAVTDAFGTPDSRGSWYLDIAASMPLGETWNAGVHVGRKQSRGTDPGTGLANDRSSYTDYKLSLAHGFSHGTSISLAYTWTNADSSLYTLNGYNVAGHHVWVALQKDF